MTRGVLLMAYGAPDALEDVEPFYMDIRGGKAPPPALLTQLKTRYEAIGGKSPLLDITRRQAKAVAAALGDEYRVYVGMRHWKPCIREAVAEMARDGITDAAAIVLAPHYSRLSVGAYMQRLDEAVAASGATMRLCKIDNWHLHPRFLDVLEQRVRQALARWPTEWQLSPHVVFTAHSLPQRIQEWNDPYPTQLLETAQALATRLDLGRWSLGYQSAGRTQEPWLGPDLLTVIDDLAHQKEAALLVCVIGFIADHLEVLYDIDLEAKPFALKRGMRLERIDMLNDDPLLVEALADVARSAFAQPELRAAS